MCRSINYVEYKCIFDDYNTAFGAVIGKLHLLSSDQIYATLFAVGHLSTEVVQNQQLTPTALQQHHLVLHLWKVKSLSKFNA